MSSYKLSISLPGTVPKISRVVAVPKNISFMDLHVVIQRIMGWEDSHLHEFRIPSKKVTIYTDNDYGITHTGKGMPEDSVLLSEFEYEAIQYIYDFGDWWMHEIKFLKDHPKDIDRPVILKHWGGHPEEDIGGVWGFNEMGYEDERLSDDELAVMNGTLFNGWRPAEVKKITYVPYDAVYCLIPALGLCDRYDLFLDPSDGSVYTTSDCDLFPKVDDTSAMIRIEKDLCVDYRKLLMDDLSVGSHFSHYLSLKYSDSSEKSWTDEIGKPEKDSCEDKSADMSDNELIAKIGSIKSGDFVSVTEGLNEIEYPESIIYGIATRNAEAVLEELGTYTDVPEPFGASLFKLMGQAPQYMTAMGPLCPQCGGHLANPRFDRSADPVKCGFRSSQPLMMTCTNCRKDTHIVIMDENGSITYEGYSIPADLLQIPLSYISEGDGLKVAENLFILGDNKQATECARSLLSEDLSPETRAVCTAILYPNRMMDDAQAIKNLKGTEGLCFSDEIASVISSIKKRLNIGDPLPIEDILDLSGDMIPSLYAILSVSRILGDRKDCFGPISRSLSSFIYDRPSIFSLLAFDELCRISLINDRSHVDFKFNRNNYNTVNWMMRYRAAMMLLIDGPSPEAEKMTRGLISEVFNGTHVPEMMNRAAYLALIAHRFGIRYKGKNLIALSIKWAIESRSSGVLTGRYFDEYLRVMLKASKGEIETDELNKALKKYGIDDCNTGMTDGDFDMREIPRLDSQFLSKRGLL